MPVHHAPAECPESAHASRLGALRWQGPGCRFLSVIHAVAGRTFPAGERPSAAGSLLSSHCPGYTWACVLCRPSPELPFYFVWFLGWSTWHLALDPSSVLCLQHWPENWGHSAPDLQAGACVSWPIQAQEPGAAVATAPAVSRCPVGTAAPCTHSNSDARPCITPPLNALNLHMPVALELSAGRALDVIRLGVGGDQFTPPQFG
jgi:hypothetical protein